MCLLRVLFYCFFVLFSFSLLTHGKNMKNYFCNRKRFRKNRRLKNKLLSRSITVSKTVIDDARVNKMSYKYLRYVGLRCSP